MRSVKLAAVLVSLVASLAMIGTEQVRARIRTVAAVSSTCDAANINDANASGCILLTVADLFGSVLGGFRFPNTASNGQAFYLSPTMTAFHAGGTLFASNLNAGAQPNYVAEVTIPALVNSANPSDMNYATFAQGFYDPTEGQWTEGADPIGLNGLVVDEANSRLLGTHGVAFDGSNGQRKSHWSHPLTLSTTGSFLGLDQFFSGYTGMAALGGYTGFTAGVMMTVPPEWQAALHGSICSGWIPPSIVWRGSYGPSIGCFDPSRIGSGLTEPHPWQPMVFYDSNHQTLGAYDSPTANPYYSASDSMGGMAFINNTRTVVVVGAHGTGPFCYGAYTPDPALNNTPDPTPPFSLCYDPADEGGHGQHNNPYVYFAWLYDALDFKKVVDGTTNPATGVAWKPWDVVPYAGAAFTFPVSNPETKKPEIAGLSYDPTTKRLYITQKRLDDEGGISVWARGIGWVFAANTHGY